MSACTTCGHEVEPGSAFCPTCGHGLSGAASAAPPGVAVDRTTTDPSDGITVKRDTRGEVVVEKKRAEGRFYRQACPHCGRSVKVPEGARRCPFCGWGLADNSPPVEEGPAGLEEPELRDPALPSAALRHTLPSGEERLVPLPHTRSVVGRTLGIPKSLCLPGDPYLSPSHAEFAYEGDRLRVTDRGSLNGVFLLVREPCPLSDGQRIVMGEQILRFELIGERGGPPVSNAEGTMPMGSGLDWPGARLVKILADGREGPSFFFAGKRRVFGRQTGHYCFPDDPLMSHQHAAIEERSGRYWITDLGSTNGTFVQIREAELGHGTVVRMGNQRFRIEYRAATREVSRG